MNSRYLWVPTLLYGVPNLLAPVVVYAAGILLVDMVPVPLLADGYTLSIDTALVAATFALLVFCIRASQGFFAGGAKVPLPNAMGGIVFALQCIALASVVLYDYGRAGSSAGSSSALAVIASYVKADLFFILYYTHARPDRFPKYNLALYVATNLLSGWSAFWLIIILVESYYHFQRRGGRFPVRRLLVIASAALLIFPVLNAMKEQIRGAEVAEFGYVASYVKLVTRLQHTTNIVLVDQESADIRASYVSGAITPWYVVSDIIARVVGRTADAVPLQRYVTQKYLIDPEAFDGYAGDYAWFTHVGIAGWFFVLAWYEMPLYLLFVAALVMAPYWVIGRVLRAPSMIPAAHVASFVYVLHGWLEVQWSFLVVVLLYAATIHLLLGQRSVQPSPAAA